MNNDEEHFDPIMYKHALHDYNSYDVKATPNHTHFLTWPHPLPGLTTLDKVAVNFVSITGEALAVFKWTG